MHDTSYVINYIFYVIEDAKCVIYGNISLYYRMYYNIKYVIIINVIIIYRDIYDVLYCM